MESATRQSAALERTRHPGIYRRGESYVAIVSWRDGSQKSRQKWLTRKTLKAALSARRDTLNELDRGIKPDGSRLTLSEFFEQEWLPEIEATRRPQTATAYRKAWRVHIKPGLGSVKLRDLNRDSLRDFYRSVKSPPMARYCHSVLSSALGWAVKDRGMLGANPCASIRPPKAERRETAHLDTDEAKRMLTEVRGHRLEGAVVLGLIGGLRVGEVCGVQWGDVDLDAGTLMVRRSFWGPTKSGKMRGVTLPAVAVAGLRRHRATQAQELLRIGLGQDEKAPVVASVYGPALSPDRLDELFGRFAREHGFGISFHGLRHTCAIAMLTSGVDVKTAAGRLGHNPALLLNTYAHFVQSADRLAAERLEGVFG
jgi:integrase